MLSLGFRLSHLQFFQFAFGRDGEVVVETRVGNVIHLADVTLVYRHLRHALRFVA